MASQNEFTPPVQLVAPCGMDCRLCRGYIREKNRCPGCRRIGGKESEKSKFRNRCKIRNCDRIAGGSLKYCSARCDRFPCTRLKQLDKRYRARYGMSMLENLEKIDAVGIRAFIREEKLKWVCPQCGAVICVHKPACLACGFEWHNRP